MSDFRKHWWRQHLTTIPPELKLLDSLAMSLRLCEQNNNAQRTGFNKQSFQNGSYKFRLRYLGAKYRILRSNSNTVRVLNYTGPFKQS